MYGTYADDVALICRTYSLDWLTPFVHPFLISMENHFSHVYNIKKRIYSVHRANGYYCLIIRWWNSQPNDVRMKSEWTRWRYATKSKRFRKWHDSRFNNGITFKLTIGPQRLVVCVCVPLSVPSAQTFYPNIYWKLFILIMELLYKPWPIVPIYDDGKN